MNIDFEKSGGLIPAIIQDDRTMQVLMLGYMNVEAFVKTRDEGLVTFYSRTRERLWTKGEESGNFLRVVSIYADCDRDTLLIRALPEGPTCHLGTTSCFGEPGPKGFIYHLESTIAERVALRPEGSYTARLLSEGVRKVAQKVGEEAVETILEAESGSPGALLSETADLMYHLLLLLQARGLSLEDVEAVLKQRSR